MKDETKKKYSELSLETIERLEDSLIENIKRSGNTILFNLKFVFSNTRLLTIIGLLYFFSMFLSVVFIPIWISGAMLQLITMIVPGLIILGTVGSNVRKSTLYKNMSLGGVKRRTFYLAQLITIIVITNILSIILWTLIWFLGSFNIFLGGWVWDGTGRIYVNPLSHGTPILIFYITMITSFVIFAAYFLIESITSSEKTYNLIVVSLFIIGVIFGGSLNSYFSRPYNYGFYDWSHSGGVSGMDYYKPFRGSDVYVSIEFYERTNGLQDFYFIDNQDGIGSSLGLFPNSVFIPTLFNPFYGVGEFTTTAITAGMVQDFYWNFDNSIIVVQNISPISELANQEVLGTLPQTSNTYIPVLSWFKLGFKDEAWMWSAVLLQPYATIITYLFIGKTLQLMKDER